MVPAAGASDAETAQSRSTPVSAAADAIVIGMYDIYFEPDRIRIPANTDVRFVFENRGAAPHNFEIKERDISVDVAPGETAAKPSSTCRRDVQVHLQCARA